MFFTRHFQRVLESLFAGNDINSRRFSGAFGLPDTLLDKIAEEEDNAFLTGAAVEEADGFPQIGALLRGSTDSSCRTMYSTCSLPFFAGIYPLSDR